MKASDILIHGKSLIADPAKWTQGDMARDASGKAVKAHDPSAVCFCSLGAFWKALDVMDPAKDMCVDLYEKSITYLYQIAIELGGGVTDYNDNHTHAEVMAFWDKAIELAKLGEQK